MALAAVSRVDASPGPNGSVRGLTIPLGTLDDEGQSDHADLLGFSGRVYVATTNGASNAVTYGVQSSHDAVSWVSLPLFVDDQGDDVVSRQVAAGAYDLLFLVGAALGRFVRVDVTAANANGSEFVLCAERD